MAAAGLYDPQFEHDACGVGFVADLSGRGGHDVVARALRVLCNLEHRGAQGGDPGTGDGAGILTQIPDEFFRASCGFELPEAGAYAAGMAFFSAERHLVTPALARLAAAEGLTILGWREVPFDITACGDGARAVLPDVLQMFIAGAEGQQGMELERMAFCLRKRAEHEAGVYFASLSARTIVYKGMLSAPQLGPFYPDLSDPRYGSTLALVHSRFSTNTFPSWPLAHPYRYVAHNGEINTVRGNRNWMRAREAMLASDLIPLSRTAWDRASLPDPRRGGQRLGQLRRVPRVAAYGRPVAAARGADDDPGAVGEPRGDDPGAARLLPVPRRADGAVGRPGADRVHRRLGDRRGARSQRPAPRALLGDQRRPGRAGQRGRRARHRPGHGDQEGAAPARPRLPGRHGGRAHRRGRGGQGGPRRRAPVRELAARRARSPRRPARPPRRGGGPRRRGPADAAADTRVHGGGTAGRPDPDGPDRDGADRVDGNRHPGRRAVRPAAAGVRLLLPAVRSGDQPAA